jgi:uncharacterized protein (DUF1330 family)
MWRGRHRYKRDAALELHPVNNIARQRGKMAKAYWVTTYRSIKNQDALAAYAKLAGPAIAAAGGRFVIRGMPAQTWEAGLNTRTVVIEFPSLEKALAAHDTPGYQEALKALGKDAVERDMRVVEGVD